MTIKYNVSGAKTRNGKEIAPMAFGDRAEAERFARYHEGLSVSQNLRKYPGIVVATETFSAKGHPQNLPKAKGTCVDGKEHGPWADNYTYCTTCGFYDFDKFEPTAEQTKAAEELFAQAARHQPHDGKDAFIGCLCEPCQSWRQSTANRTEKLVPLALHLQQVGRVERKSPPVTIVVDPKVFMAGVEEHTGPVQVLKLPKEIVCELTDPLDKELTDKVAARVLTYDPSKAISLADMQARYAQPLERTATVGNADLEEAYAMGYRLAVANSFWKGCTDEDVETQDYVDQRRSDLKELVSYDRSL